MRQETVGKVVERIAEILTDSTFSSTVIQKDLANAAAESFFTPGNQKPIVEPGVFDKGLSEVLANDTKSFRAKVLMIAFMGGGKLPQVEDSARELDKPYNDSLLLSALSEVTD